MALPTQKQMHKALVGRYGETLQKRISGACVAVCGLGGLGSNIALSLARAGVGRLILIDFDRVDISNLNRQQYAAGQIGMYKADALGENLRQAAPYVRLDCHALRITPENISELLGDADIICEAFDRPEEKAMLVNGAIEQLPDKYIVAASGMAGLGSANDIQTRRIGERIYICGDGVSDAGEAPGLLAPRVMLCAAHQAQMVLRILAGETQP